MNEFGRNLIQEEKRAGRKLGLASTGLGSVFSIAGVLGCGDGRILSSILVAILGMCLLIGGIFSLYDAAGSKSRAQFEKNLSDYGISIEALEADMNAAEKFRNIWLGENFLLEKGLSLHTVPYRDLVWVYIYKKTTQQKLEGVIPCGSSAEYKVAYYNRTGSMREVETQSEAEAEAIVRAIYERAPYLVFGWNEEIKIHFGEVRQLVQERCSRYYNG